MTTLSDAHAETTGKNTYKARHIRNYRGYILTLHCSRCTFHQKDPPRQLRLHRPFQTIVLAHSHSVFITGASKGIGRCIALSFARSGASKIAVGARSSLDSVEAEILNVASKAGHPVPLVLKLQLDVLDKDNVKRAAEEVEKAFGDGGLDVLVNNAAYFERLRPFSGPDVDEW